MTTDGRLPFDDPSDPPAGTPVLPDAAARAFAVDPTRNVVLEASAGTGKTRVLVDRYVNLLREGVDPASVLAITFTRKAAAEMRERIVGRLRAMAATGELAKSRWNELRARLGDIAISTIDAFCLALLREFPLEADVDPGFDLADETQVPRLIAESLDATLRICRALAQEHEEVALVFAQLGEPRLRDGLAMLLERRLVAPDVLQRFLAAGPKNLTLEVICTRTAHALFDALALTSGGLTGFLADGPVNDPAFGALGDDLRRLREAVTRGEPVAPARLRTVLDGLRDLVFTGSNSVRKRAPGAAAHYETTEARKRTLDRVNTLAEPLGRATKAFRRDLNALLARGVRQIYAVADRTYRRTLETHAVLDFTEVLSRALRLLEQMEEFARSRWRLESRYHHVLVDEFQDTNRAQWDLVQLLIQSWGEGFGLASSGPLLPTVFIVGDRKQSIYGFRDADVRVLTEAARAIGGLRQEEGDPRRAISVSFRAVPELLAFVNDLFTAMPSVPRDDAFRYGETDRFPVVGEAGARDALGLVVAETVDGCAEAAAAEVARLLREGVTVRDRETGLARRIQAGDIAILFRTRETHRAYERALERRRIRSYVYKGLGFFESDEIVDVLALLRYLADPQSDLRAAAFLRSRFVRLSDPAIGRLAPRLAGALLRADAAGELAALDADDRRVLELTRASVRDWLDLADRIPPAELLDHVLAETAYAFELRGPRWPQARENLKKLRGLVRRIQNRGYATLARVAGHLDVLSMGDESNAIIDAADAVNLMTVHAAKGLEFPVVFVVNLGKGSGGLPPAIRIVTEDGDGQPSVAVGEAEAELDDELKAREREETKRLLYVAVTRARDRLYLSTVVHPAGKTSWAHGSLGRVLSDDVRRLFDQAVAARSPIVWTGPGGRHHEFRVHTPPPADAPIDVMADELMDRPAPIDLELLVDAERIDRVPVTAYLTDSGESGRATTGGARRFEADTEYLVTGTLVHRLLQFDPAPDEAADDPAQLTRRAFALLRPEERVDLEDPDAVVERALAVFEAIRSRPEVAGRAVGGQAFDEVPFSLRVSPALIVRGAIDRLVRGPGPAATVLEFKTGGPKPEHRAQLDLYLDAIRALLPDVAVDGEVIYPVVDG